MRQQLKRDSKKILRHQIGKALAIAFMVVAVVLFFWAIERLCAVTLGVLGFESLLAQPHIDLSSRVVQLSLLIILLIAVLRFFVLSPIYMGQVSWYWNAACYPNTPVWEMFSQFSSLRMFGRSLWYTVNIWARCALYTVLFMLPSGLLLFFGYRGYLAASSSWMIAVGSVALMLSVLLFIFTVPLLYCFLRRYFLAKYIVVSHPEVTVRQAFFISVRQMRGHRGEIMMLDLSFFPWFLSCIFIIPILYAVPHYFTVCTLYARCYLYSTDFADYRGSRAAGK
ncbi:Protein of uncharacterised function (DUF975) [Anaerotruncus sp. 2789STDY5834896]|uniref:Protein of uncharacterized function (DUF975) n=1 Tax=uncultured Anaerotruncus sp. TaxID=905011 RepID=A0A1C6IH06_9FIRM|nr:Protein of uncharacterised function (DUF975) [uncultured Anaerotruncus sp.]